MAAKQAEEIEIIISEISKQFKAIYGEEISDKDVIRLRDYANVYHQARKRVVSIPLLILTRSRESIDNKRRYEDTELVNLLNKIVGKKI